MVLNFDKDQQLLGTQYLHKPCNNSIGVAIDYMLKLLHSSTRALTRSHEETWCAIGTVKSGGGATLLPRREGLAPGQCTTRSPLFWCFWTLSYICFPRSKKSI